MVLITIFDRNGLKQIAYQTKLLSNYSCLILNELEWLNILLVVQVNDLPKFLKRGSIKKINISRSTHQKTAGVFYWVKCGKTFFVVMKISP